MEAGRLRHRIDIDEKIETQDGNGDPVVTWKPFARRVPAAIEPLSAKEFLSLNQPVAQGSARIVIRWMAGVLPTMRARHGETIYNILGVLSDRESGRDYLTLPVSRGTNEG